MNGTAKVEELVLLGGRSAARIVCDSSLIPTPGRYVLAHEPASAALLANALFLGGSCSGGFVAAPPIHSAWRPGAELNLRGPLGHGFTLPAHARHVALVCIGNDPARLLPVAELALSQNAAVALVCDDPPDHLPLQLEIQPERALPDVLGWCDYAAYDVEQSALGDLLRRLIQLRDTAEAGAFRSAGAHADSVWRLGRMRCLQCSHARRFPAGVRGWTGVRCGLTARSKLGEPGRFVLRRDRRRRGWLP